MKIEKYGDGHAYKVQRTLLSLDVMNWLVENCRDFKYHTEGDFYTFYFIQ
jgi:hypothetical protein